MFIGYRLIQFKVNNVTYYRTIRNSRNLGYTLYNAPFSKSKFNLKSDSVNLVAPASPIKCLLYLPNNLVIRYKLGPERLTQLGNSNVLRLPVINVYYISMIKPNMLRIHLKDSSNE